MIDLATADAIATAAAVRAQTVSAVDVVTASLDRIQAQDARLNCFTAVLADDAMAQAQAVDEAIAAGQDPGPLAGVPFAVKNLFDIAGLTTLAGSMIERDTPPAIQDATAIARLKQSGGILMGALNMDEYAYGFVTENTHYGNTRNPHDVDRVAGGSSGGSAASVAAGLVPLTLGSDTNGSIRVPASLCGIFGLKPTYGRLSRAGSFPFVASLDHIGPFARSVRDVAASFDAIQGPDPRDPVCSDRPPVTTLDQLHGDPDALRIAIADNYFAQGGLPEVFAALDQVASALGVTQRVTLPESSRARAAAYVITASEGGNLHMANLRRRAQDFDPATRDRLIAGAMVPSDWYIQAQRFRRWYQAQVAQVFQTVDVIMTPATPCPAPEIGQTRMVIDGVELVPRAHLGCFTQPISFIGLPALSVPVARPGALPIGVQLIAAPYQEAKLFQVAAALERQGVVASPVAS
ncbi:MAG TPA: AtzE family amidohydrolase [Candidatus Obscuribacterales bacterium]